MSKKEIIIGLMAALFLAAVIAMFASPWPDGLEKVAGDKGFIERSEVEPFLSAPVPEYAWPGIKNGRLAVSLAGSAGTLTVFLLTYGVFLLIKKH